MAYLWLEQKENQRRRPPEKDMDRISAILQDKLKLTDGQLNQFRKIREEFAVKEEVLSLLIKSQRDSMNEEMFRQNSDSVRLKILAKHVSENEYRMECYRIEQAGRLKSVCNEEQLKKFRELVIEIRDYFRPVDRKQHFPRRK